MKRIISILVLITAACALQSCAAVRPYEREFLAERIMDFEANLDELGMDQHFLETREGSTGGFGGAGGGCACN